MIQLLDKAVSFAQAHPVGTGVVAFYVFSTVIASMPAPDEKSGKLYKFVFAFGHAIAASLPRAIAVMWPALAAKFPFLSNGNGAASDEKEMK